MSRSRLVCWLNVPDTEACFLRELPNMACQIILALKSTVLWIISARMPIMAAKDWPRITGSVGRNCARSATAHDIDDRSDVRPSQFGLGHRALNGRGPMGSFSAAAAGAAVPGRSVRQRSCFPPAANAPSPGTSLPSCRQRFWRGRSNSRCSGGRDAGRTRGTTA